jgi:hypothetical protein
MTVSYPLSLPSVSGIRQTKFTLKSKASIHESPWTGEVQVQEHSGKFWEAVFEIPPMDRSDFAEWEAFFASLRGRVGTFKAGPQYASSSQGDNDGSDKTVESIDSTSTKLTVSGFASSTNGVMLTGDYIEVNNELKIVRSDADSDGSGEATLDIEPLFRTDPSQGDTCVIADPKAKMRLLGDVQVDFERFTSNGITFSAREDF